MTLFKFLAAALVIGGVVAVAPIARAQQPASAAPQMDHQPTTGPAPMSMGMHEKMMADMKAMDVSLDALVTKMNAATGSAKVDAIAEALTMLVGQHKSMRDGMMQMNGQMMMQMHAPAGMPMGGVR
jgi:hypothetical protein